MTVTSVPTTYRGVTYRSALEADWAATFDEWEVYYEYEPQPYRLPSGAVYDVDFYLPGMYTYCEAKGPHNARRWKPLEFVRAISEDNFKPDQYLVLMLRSAGPGNVAAWEPADPSGRFPVVVDCLECQHYGFAVTNDNGETKCRRCGNVTHHGLTYRSALDPGRQSWHESMQITRAPRGGGA